MPTERQKEGDNGERAEDAMGNKVGREKDFPGNVDKRNLAKYEKWRGFLKQYRSGTRNSSVEREWLIDAYSWVLGCDSLARVVGAKKFHVRGTDKVPRAFCERLRCDKDWRNGLLECVKMTHRPWQ
jgi:hypothetical protein